MCSTYPSRTSRSKCRRLFGGQLPPGHLDHHLFCSGKCCCYPHLGVASQARWRVRLFVICTLFFTLASLACALSFNFPMLLISRTFQGAVAGPMIPVSQSLLLSNYPVERRGFANGVWGMTAVVGPIAGPILGGWITDNYHWSWIFLINVPVGILAL